MILVAVFTGHLSFSQIGAEAQGGKMTLWTALGIDQELSDKWISVTDIGYGRHSDPDNEKLLKRQGLAVITQDFIRKYKHWRFAFSIGYWRRNFYNDLFPYNEVERPHQFRNEIRPFNRIYYDHLVAKLKITHALRFDYRFYYDQTFKNVWPTPFEFRIRYMINSKWPFTSNMKNWIIVNDEVLSAVDKYSSAVALAKNISWSAYQITENRLSLYYRRSMPGSRIDFDIGMMYQYWRDKPGATAFNNSLNLMADIIIRDPFTKKNGGQKDDMED